MAETPGLDRLPQLTTKSLVKISHAMIDRDRASPKWTHVTERDGLVLALDHVRFPTASQQYTERRILRVLSGPEVVVCEAICGAVLFFWWVGAVECCAEGNCAARQAYLDLDENMKHPSMELYRRYGSQISLDQLSLGFLVRGTNLKITYDAGNSQVRRPSRARAARCLMMAVEEGAAIEVHRRGRLPGDGVDLRATRPACKGRRGRRSPWLAQAEHGGVVVHDASQLSDADRLVVAWQRFVADAPEH